MIRAGLTEPQSRLLAFIGEFIAARGYSPSYMEMRDGLGLTSIGGVTSLLAGLQDRGYVQRLSRRRRSVMLTHAPPPAAKALPPTTETHAPGAP